MRAAVASFVRGIGSVVRAPGIVVAVWAFTIAAAAPFVLVLGAELQAALAHQPPIDLAAEEIDADWWQQFRGHADGLAATFTPVVLGAAAPLATFSALLDGSLSFVTAIAIAVYAVLWSLLLGGILHRYHRRSASLSEVSAAALRYFPQFVTLTALAGGLVLLLYATVHPVLFGPVYAAIASPIEAAPSAFAIRTALYLLFGASLAAIGLTVDYSRVALVSGRSKSVGEAIARALRFMRQNAGPVVALVFVTAILFGIVLAGYVAADLQFRGWRSVVLGQMFVCARLVTRLISASSQIELVRRLETGD